MESSILAFRMISPFRGPDYWGVREQSENYVRVLKAFTVIHSLADGNLGICLTWVALYLASAGMP